MNNNQKAYRQLIATKNDCSIFAQPWWLDATAGLDNWNAIIHKNHAFAFEQKNKFFQKAILPSVLTPYQPFVNNTADLINDLKNFDFVEFFVKDFDDQLQNIFLQNGFDCSLKHTRELALGDLISIYNNFKPSLQRQIKKAEKNLSIEIDTDLKTFYAVSGQTFVQQKQPIPFTFEQLKKIDTACQKNQSGHFLIAYNKTKQACGAAYIVFDKNCCYYIAGGIATEFKNSGAMCLLLWKAIQLANERSKYFDFCGSTIDSIDKFFSTFDAIKKNVLVVNRFANKLQRWAINKLKK